MPSSTVIAVSVDRGKMAFTFDELDDFFQKNTYPSSCYGKPGRKKNFRRAAAKFHLRDGILHRMVKHGNKESSLRVIRDEKEREEIVSDTHTGLGDSAKSKASGGHFGFDKTEEKIASRVWWPSIRKDVRTYIKACDHCQHRVARLQKRSEQLHQVEISPHPWSQIGVDICSMPKSKEGFTCMVLAVDYFSKWTEAEALHKKTAEGVANFLYNCICRHGYFDIQINYGGHEFVNSISTELHRLTSFKLKLTSPYHPQANALVEQSTRAIQDMIMKLFSDASFLEDWPKALPGILFALRTSTHASTKPSPFFLLYGREPKLPGQQFTSSETQTETEWAFYSEQQNPSDETQTETECEYSEQQNASDKTQTETECEYSEQQNASDETQTETECEYSEQQNASDETQTETECTQNSSILQT
ncbi:Gag-Pol fusion protein [Plakobranchus ocellatus]|uniref:Gag-Pol fusion protein n=1 Tax=Plakobranchus ocellatus TaxID=259542 RepID=A0AAV4BQK0_9GAST|nr:Gag-Pol fusion protein [Plakobranchus ocellatus]